MYLKIPGQVFPIVLDVELHELPALGCEPKRPELGIKRLHLFGGVIEVIIEVERLELQFLHKRQPGRTGFDMHVGTDHLVTPSAEKTGLGVEIFSGTCPDG
jgi:hypothetical protein